MNRAGLTKILCLVCGLLFLTTSANCEELDAFAKWRIYAKSSDAKKMVSWMHCSMKAFLSNNNCRQLPDFSTPSYYGKFGIFVTLVKKGKVRGCFGAFNHQSDKIDDVLKDYLQGALKRDHRYQPLDAAEADEVDVIITVAGRKYQVDDIDSIDIVNYGAVVTMENNEIEVIVPSEIKSIDALKRRLKGREINQVSVFKAVTIK